MWFGRISLITLAAVYIVLTTRTASPESWVGFYTPTVSAPQTVDHSLVGNACLGNILDVQARHGIPDNLLLAIGIQRLFHGPGHPVRVHVTATAVKGQYQLVQNHVVVDADAGYLLQLERQKAGTIAMVADHVADTVAAKRL